MLRGDATERAGTPATIHPGTALPQMPTRAAAVARRPDGTVYTPAVEPEPEPEVEHVETAGGFHGDSEVELGQSMVTHGVASIGLLRVECGGEINEQLWGAGVALSAWFLHAGAPVPLARSNRAYLVTVNENGCT